MVAKLSIESASIEPAVVTLKTDVDPTGGAVAFGLTASGTETPSTSSAGSWSGSWDATTKLVDAITPTIGATGATLELTEGSVYNLWALVGTTVWKKAATITVT